MAQNRFQNSRVFGRSIGNMKDASPPIKSFRGRTEEQKKEDLRVTLVGYEAWRREREARKAKRYDAFRARNLGS